MTTLTTTWDESSMDELQSNERVTRAPFRLPAGSGLAAAAIAAAAGFALIAYTWFRVSDLTNTAKQIPYLVSGGLTGLGLVVLGSALLVVVTRGGDDKVREQQADALVKALQDLAARDPEVGR